MFLLVLCPLHFYIPLIIIFFYLNFKNYILVDFFFIIFLLSKYNFLL